MADKTHLSIRMDAVLHDKFKYVAGADGRSMSGEILYLIQKCVRDYEKQYGPIPVVSRKETDGALDDLR